MEGSWEGIAGCVVHVDVHGEYVHVYVLGECSVVLLSMAGIVCLVCRNCGAVLGCMVCWQL